MRNALAVLWILLCSIASAAAQMSVGIGLPGISIGIDVPMYPQLVPVPGYPVYYAPQVNSNYFFYDGMYWIYQRDNWYASSWYNGPWMLVGPEAVPLFVLRVPVHYYRQPPVYFRGWRSDAPPRWGEHWGNSWQQSHGGWDNWDRRAVYAPAPLPAYQRQYSGNRYPQAVQQQSLQSQNYRYQPRDAVVQQHYQAQQSQSAPAAAPQGRPGATQERGAPKQGQPAASPPIPVPQPAAPVARVQPPQSGSGDVGRPVTSQAPPRQVVPSTQNPAPPPQQAVAPRQPQTTRPQGQDNPAQAQAPVQTQAPQSPQAAPRQPQATRPQAQDLPPQGRAPAQNQAPQPQQAVAPRQPQATRPQGQDNAQQGKMNVQEPRPQRPAAQPQQPAAQREQQAPKAQVKVPAQESKQAQDKGRDKGEPKGAEQNK